ncbi:hypothetical protein DFR50_112124 [Roseiarcus fermentans]|uniref:Uncharacterized protein n=1 Tax=Roseiarcus fermentans TaxID=1473586 RepID=A0A366FEQ2_9HYPH|nr:hypothetical protein [Roseiarcus fermentans]RBP13153.1 hypothetical protein DFR50_112124 [Roseiarcus fermentans]
MNAIANLAPRSRVSALSALMVAASVALTLGFSCALPLAAFATMAAMLFGPAAAIGSILSVWLANQIVGFACLGYPIDASTFAWGAGLALILLLAVGAAAFVLARVGGAVGVVAAFVAAFVTCQGAVSAGCLLTGDGVAHFTLAVVTRIFLINAATFGGFLALRALGARAGLGTQSGRACALRHA